MQPNMKKEYRAELKLLRKNRARCGRELKSFVSAMNRKVRELLKSMRAEINPILRDIASAERQTKRSLTRYDKRIAILEGRLS